MGSRCKKTIKRLRLQPTKRDIVAANMDIPKHQVPRSGTMLCQLANAKDRSPFDVAHVGVRGAGQGKPKAKPSTRWKG